MSDLKSNTRYYLNCQVLAKKDDSVNTGMMVLADTGTQEIWTKRNVLSTLISFIGTVVVLGVLVVAAITLWKLKPWASTPV